MPLIIQEEITLDHCPRWQKPAEELTENANIHVPDSYTRLDIPEYNHRLVDQMSG